MTSKPKLTEAKAKAVKSAVNKALATISKEHGLKLGAHLDKANGRGSAHLRTISIIISI